MNVVGFDIDEPKMNQIARTVHGMKYLLKERLGFKFTNLSLPKKLTNVYTSRGKMNESDFEKRVELYFKFVEEDKRLASRAL